MQHDNHLNINIRPGAPASAVPRGWFMFVNNVLRYLNIVNGRIIADGDKWTIVCGGGTGGDGFDVAGVKAQYKVVILLPDGESNLVPTWDYVRLP